MTQTTILEETTLLTTFPLSGLAQPLVDFLRANGVATQTTGDQTGLGLNAPAQVLVAESDLARAQALLADFWAQNEADGSES